ncbi:MAG TPA: 3-hydroxyacyl-CoA dehydrogenase NAD-binding domain-containing protein [Jatrophihabitantaceae bacterium]|jgi:3-hydroxyacyl-CoA dehydrogenase/enoyl-CoA hydratase/carnithine racemase|nr:3-hydroxyacyl-CoA dehydrogenase NAD-binding domain-containing protein [Jatrophihabitantaceae bacterium]
MSTATLPDEVVTAALVRYLDVPGVAGEVALITLENGLDHTRPSTFGPAGLASLDDAMDQIEAHAPRVAAIAVTGKPFIFAVGADISGVPSIHTREQALEIGRLGHRVFRRFTDSAVPTFAFVNGAVMGGGLELALHCHYRTLAKKAAAIAFPEVFLGLVPGWGGTQLLPRLIGPQGAVKVIIENAMNQNKMLSPAQAVELGVVDLLLDDADFVPQSLAWLAGVLDGSTQVARPDHSGADWDSAIAAGRAFADGKIHGAAPAPYRALDLIAMARTADLTSGTAAEDDALADLIMGDELRSSLYAFDLVNKRAKRPAGAPDKALARPVTKVGVVGAGLMASQLALLFARRLEVPVVMTDLDQERLDKGVGYVHAEIDQLLAKGRLNPDKANRLKALVSGSLTKDAFADADVVIEAVFEEIKIKKQVFAEVEEHVGPEALLLTNTSSLSVTEMAADLAHPERVVGFHFFNPVAVLPLLEIVRAERTDDASLATAFAIGKKLGKSSVLVKDAPAFVVNRLLTRFLGEVTATVDEGTPIEVADAALAPLGLPMSPFVLLALVGPAVALHVSETMHAAFPGRFSVSENSRRLVAAGKGGIYAWDETGQHIDPDVQALFVQGDSPSSVEQVRERALAALADEVRIMLDEGVVAAPQDIDLCMILGAGWPFHLGGITPYLDRAGVSEAVTGRRFLERGVASLP